MATPRLYVQTRARAASYLQSQQGGVMSQYMLLLYATEAEGEELAEREAVLATLIRHVGDFQLAEDAVQDAYAAALTTWPRDGVPSNPGAWLTVTARRRAIDRLRRDRSVADRADRLAELVRLDQQEHPVMTDESAIVDDRLRLIFTCCHPALDISARVALTLRAL